MDKPSKAPRNLWAWGLMVFGAIFVFAGLSVGAAPVKDIASTVKARSWQATEAHMSSVELKTSYGESTTYKATGRYHYEWDGRRYTSTQLMFSAGSDSHFKYHDDFVRALQKAHRAGDPVPVWVNPKNPSESVLTRKPRWGKYWAQTVFCLIFTMAGSAVILVGWLGRKWAGEEEDLKEAHPHEPWKWNSNWRSKTLKNSNRMMFWMLFGGTIMWNLMGSLILSVMHEEVIEGRNYLALIALTMPAAGVFMIWKTWQIYQRTRRFGETYLSLETHPAALGYYLRGGLHINSPLPDDAVFEVKLNAIHLYVSRSGQNRRTSKHIKWQDQQILPATRSRSGKGSTLPIYFDLPRAQAPTSYPNADETYLWRLDVRSKLDGADYKQSFDIPVYDPKDFPAIIPSGVENAADAAFAAKHAYVGDWRKTGVVFQEDVDGQYYYFPAARHKGVAYGVTFMALLFTGLALGVWLARSAAGMSIFIGCFALVFIIATVNMWLLKTAVEITKESLIIRSGYFQGRALAYERREIESLAITGTMRAGAASYFNLVAKTRSGKTIRLANKIVGKRDVESLREKMCADLGITADIRDDKNTTPAYCSPALIKLGKR